MDATKGIHRPAGRTAASQVERAYQGIKAAIVDGRYPPGRPLAEPTLAAEHGTSRTPVREGLVRLWQEGYVERVAGHGYFVARITVQSIHDTFDVRRLLEGAAAARAAALATPADVERLRRLAGATMGAEYRAAEAANLAFHREIAACARNTLALELIERCLAQIDRFMSLGVDFGPFPHEARDAHMAIVEAIARRDGAAARERMEVHLDSGSRLMKDALLRGQNTSVGVD